jgi:hypothetical protein
MLPSGTTDRLEGRSWDMVGAMALRGTWKKWRGARVITERGDNRPCRKASETELPLGGKLMWKEGDVWVTDGRGGHADQRGGMDKRHMATGASG